MGTKANNPTTENAALGATTPTNIIQAGMIVAFAGDITNSSVIQSLATLGWLPCDGSSYPKSQYPLLAIAIGTAYGGSGGSKGSFNVPDLRGRFLRGTSYGSKMDPDTDSRIAMNLGGNTGNAIGSLQLSATALPNNPFILSSAGEHTHTVPNVPQGSSNAYALAGDHYALTNTGGVTSDSQGLHNHHMENWDNESRPVNLYVNFLISTGTGSNSNVTIPLYGMISAFGFSLQGTPEPAAPWLFCDGTSEEQAAYPNLFTAIETIWGKGIDTSSFNLPNLQGTFIRGVNPSSNSLATYQTDLTGMPNNPNFQAATAGDHFHNVPHVPTDYSGYYPIAGNHHYGSNPGTQTSLPSGIHTHQCGVSTGSGGDSETRPVNAYVDFGILGDAGTDPTTDTFPVGTITPYGGTLNQATLSAANWLNCDGTAVPRSQYQTLFQAIGTSFGAGDGVSTFNLPNLVGVFPRGVNGAASGIGYDPDATSRISQPGTSGGNTGNSVGSYQSGATGAPVIPMLTSSDGLHSHIFPNVPNEGSNSAVAGSDEAIWNSNSVQSSTNGSHTHPVASGGDSETRPGSASCYYIIKFQ